MKKNNYILLGAGAIAEQLYLRYFEHRSDTTLWVLDKNLKRLTELQKKFPRYNYSDDDFDLVITRESFSAGFVCLPNHLHAAFIKKFQQAQIPVLVEKPVVINPADFATCHDENSTPVFVAHLRRFFASSIFIKQIIAESVYGSVTQVEVSDGGVFNWKLQSDYLLSQEKSGGGVLMDSGIHWIDFLFSVLGELKLSRYLDNSRGGVESECTVEFSFRTGIGALRFSRLRKVSRFIRIEFEKASLVFSLDQPDLIKLKIKAHPLIEFNHYVKDQLSEAFMSQMNAFFSRVRAESTSSSLATLPGAQEALRPVQFIHLCYESRT